MTETALFFVALGLTLVGVGEALNKRRGMALVLWLASSFLCLIVLVT